MAVSILGCSITKCSHGRDSNPLGKWRHLVEVIVLRENKMKLSMDHLG